MSSEQINPSLRKQKMAYALQQYRLGNYDEVEKVCFELLDLEPNNLEIVKILAVLSWRINKLEQAKECYKKLLKLEPENKRYYANLAEIAFEQGNTEECLEFSQQLIDLNPDCPDSWFEQGIFYAELGYTEEAISCFEEVLSKEPENIQAAWNLAISRLVMGDLKRGFAGYEQYRWESRPGLFKSPDFFGEPIWNGFDLTNHTILLHGDDGYGDAIQFIRYAALLKSKNTQVIFLCPEPLFRLFSVIKGIDQLLKEQEMTKETLPNFQVHAPLLSLPYCFSTTLDTIPGETPYISISELQNQFSGSLPKIPYIPEGTRLKVGIAWGTGANQRMKKLGEQGGSSRDCNLAYFARLLEIKGITLFSFQIGEHYSELDEFRQEERIQDLNPLIHDFADTAALIAQLDLVISVDTSLGHLAGAMGIPVWVLLPFFHDWRWLKNRQDTPWYSTMKLFRQTNRGDWDSVFTKVILELKLILGDSDSL